MKKDKNNKKNTKKNKKIIIPIIIILLVTLSIGGYLIFKQTTDKSTSAKTKVVDKIDNYGYTLEKDATNLYKDLFKKLQKVLNENEVNEEEYAKLIAQMASSDFYTLDNKMSKNDIGGSQFIYEPYRKNFVLEASETVYKYIQHNLYGTRTQQLPEVDQVDVEEIKQESYKYKKISDEKAYTVKVKLVYKKDMGYPSNVTVKLLHNNKKLEVYYMK